MRVAVVGAGVAGLVLARRLVAAGVDTTLWEASDRVGGQLCTMSLWGSPIDVGAEALHLGTPAVSRLLAELDLTESVVPAAPGASLLVTRKGLRPLPAGVGPVGPTRIGPVVGSGILSVRGMARAGLEPFIARRRRIDADVSVGAFIRGRFGDEVAQQFVDPLLGNLHSGDIDSLSLFSTARQLLPKAREGRSLLPNPLARRPRRRAGSPQFGSLPGGLGEFVTSLARGLDVRLHSAVLALTPQPDGWLVETAAGVEAVDAVALACPARIAASLLDPHRPGVGDHLNAGRTADVATVVLAYERPVSGVLDDHNGLLLSSTSGHLTKAFTNLSRKWPHVRSPDLHFVRASVGRAGQDDLNRLTDEEVVRRVTDELHALAGLPACAARSHVVRWPGAMPQLEVGHAERIRRVRAALADLPPVALVGAPYDGIGVGSTITAAEARATELIALLAGADIGITRSED